MTFQIDLQRKKKTQLLIIKHKPAYQALKLVALFFLWGGVAGTVLYATLNIAIPGWSMVTINGVLQKDTSEIIFTALHFVVLGFVMYLALRALLGNLSGRDAGGRVYEELVLMNDVLRYTFSIKFQFAASHRIIIIIPIKDIASAKYDPKTNAIQLCGRFSSDSVDDYFSGEKITPESGNLNEFVLYDYFAPSLLDSLKTKGVFK